MKISVFMFLVLFGTIGQSQPYEHEHDLSLNIRSLTGAQAFSLKESVLLDFQITNSGPDAVGVFTKLGFGYQGGLILHVLDSAGAEVQPPTLTHDFLDLRAAQETSNYHILQPDQFFGIRQRFRLSELVSKPGRYKLLAEYHCPLEPKYAKVDNFWSIERKSVISNQIDLHVE